MRFKGSITALGLLLFISLIVNAQSPQVLSEQKNAIPFPEPRQVLPEEKPLIGSLDGRLLFRAYCATCHGLDAKGGGPAASALKTPPADLTLISQRNGGKFPTTRVMKTISGEDVVTAAHGNREMPIWGPIFGQINWDQDFGNVRIYNLAKYLETLQEKYPKTAPRP